MLGRLPFSEIWVQDFEFLAPPGERQTPICFVARELRSGRTICLWQNELYAARGKAPFSTSSDALHVAYYASAEWQCYRQLDWPYPQRCVDLFAEFRCETNGLQLKAGSGLLGALFFFGIPTMAVGDKDLNRSLILSGGPWDETQKRQILDYCAADVGALAELFYALLPRILTRTSNFHYDMGHALLRGRYTASVADMEHRGVPVDLPVLTKLRSRWPNLRSALIQEIDKSFNVFEGQSFRTALFEAYLQRHRIPWPKLPSGNLKLDDGTFRSMAKAYPQISPLRELRHTLSELRLNDLAVGQDARNRTLLSMFRSKTGRNQPSNSRFIFGPSVWLRSLITPAPGTVLIHADFSAQEIAVAAALSQDERLIQSYLSGDPYLDFARQARLVPPDATKLFHRVIRDRCKAVVLGVQYGMQADSMALRIGIPRYDAAELIRLHKLTYRKFWRWIDQNLTAFELGRSIRTPYGWTLHAGPEWKHTALLNWPMQASGAEMLRLACIGLTEAGMGLCAPIHDAVLVEAPSDDAEGAAEAVRDRMRQAGRLVMGGLDIRSDIQIIPFGERYADERGAKMWQTIMRMLDAHEAV